MKYTADKLIDYMVFVKIMVELVYKYELENHSKK